MKEWIRKERNDKKRKRRNLSDGLIPLAIRSFIVAFVVVFVVVVVVVVVVIVNRLWRFT